MGSRCSKNMTNAKQETNAEKLARIEMEVRNAMKKANAEGKHATFEDDLRISIAIRFKKKDEAKNLEWRATYTTAASQAAALAALALADSRIPLVCSMQLEMNHLHYCNDCHRCGVDCMPSSCSANCCPVGRSEPDFYENLEHDTLSNQFKAAEKRLLDALKRQNDSWEIAKSLYPYKLCDDRSIYDPLEALGAFGLARWNVKNARFELNQIKMARDTWVRKSSDMFKSILEKREKEAVAKREREDWDKIQDAWMSEDNMCM